MLEAAKGNFTTVFMEQEDNTEFIEKYDVSYFPTLIWTDRAGIELTRSAQPTDSEEVLGDQELAIELLAEDAASED